MNLDSINFLDKLLLTLYLHPFFIYFDFFDTLFNDNWLVF